MNEGLLEYNIRGILSQKCDNFFYQIFLQDIQKKKRYIKVNSVIKRALCLKPKNF